jgi:hypothetical protein
MILDLLFLNAFVWLIKFACWFAKYMWIGTDRGLQEYLQEQKRLEAKHRRANA